MILSNETKRDWLGVAHQSNTNLYKRMDQLKVGDVVYLNSEKNVQMTVTSVEDGEIQCIYFNSSEHKFVQTMAMPEAAVTLTQNTEDYYR